MSSRLVRVLGCRDALESEGPDALLRREWIVTNGLGGYASGTVAGIDTRRYHGLLIAALDAPRGRTMMLNHLAERVGLGDGRVVRLGGRERPGVLTAPDAAALVEFRLEAIQALGGNGYINEFPTGRLLRDAKLYEIGAGTNEIRRMLIGRELFHGKS